jgi:predicted outer membrane protein
MKSRLTADVAETYPFRNLFDDENQAGIAAKQALDKSHNKDVKAFAEAMVRDHEAVNKQARNRQYVVAARNDRRHSCASFRPLGSSA